MSLMTVAEKLRMEGRELGREESREDGRKEERVRIARILLQTGHDEAFLIQHLKVNQAELKSIRSLEDHFPRHSRGQ
jgi:predicted transposase YdaD